MWVFYFNTQKAKQNKRKKQFTTPPMHIRKLFHACLIQLRVIKLNLEVGLQYAIFVLLEMKRKQRWDKTQCECGSDNKTIACYRRIKFILFLRLWRSVNHCSRLNVHSSSQLQNNYNYNNYRTNVKKINKLRGGLGSRKGLWHFVRKFSLSEIYSQTKTCNSYKRSQNKEN